jgi:sec-independent protein translocase protein TatA
MMGFGFPELIFILVIIFVIFGAGKLPGLGEAIGKGIKNFKKAYKEPDITDITPPKDGKANDKPSQ